MSGWIKSTVNQNMNQEEPVVNTLPTTTQPSPKPVTSPQPTSTVNLSNPNKEVMDQMTELSKNNQDFNDVFDDLSEEDTQNIVNDLQNGEQVETVADRLAKRRAERQAKKDARGSKPKKDIPWDVIATAVSGLGAMFGVSPFINFTQFGFDVTNRRDERRAESEGKQKALAKAGEGEVTTNRKDDVATYTEQRAEENKADNAAAIKMATEQLQAQLSQLGLELNSREKIAFEQMKNDKELKNLELEAQKVLAEAGFKHSKEMVDIMAQGQYKAYLTAVDKGFKGSYADYNRSEAGRSTWEAALGAAAQIGNVAVQAYGAATGK